MERRFDTAGRNNRTRRSTSDKLKHILSVNNVDNNAIDLSFGKPKPNVTNLNPDLYDVRLNQDLIEPISEASEYYSYSSPYEEDEIFYDDVYFDEEDDYFDEEFFQPFKPTKKPPIATRTWLDNVLKFRESLFGKKGKPQVMVHYPKDEDPFVTLTEARRPPLGVKPNVLNAGGLPPVVSIQNPSTVVSQPATVISQPAIL